MAIQPYFDPVAKAYHDNAGGTYYGDQYQNLTPNRTPTAPPDPASAATAPPVAPPAPAAAPPAPAVNQPIAPPSVQPPAPPTAGAGIQGMDGGSANQAALAAMQPQMGRYDQQGQQQDMQSMLRGGGQMNGPAPYAGDQQASMGGSQMGQATAPQSQTDQNRNRWRPQMQAPDAAAPPTDDGTQAAGAQGQQAGTKTARRMSPQAGGSGGPGGTAGGSTPASAGV